MSLKSKERCLTVLTVVCSVLVAALLVEIFLGLVKYPRRAAGPDYGSTWRQEGLGPGGFLKEGLETYVTDGYGGKVRWKNNATGFRNDGEVSAQPPPGVLRLLSLGDSFTAGYRVGQEETFSYLLEQWLNARYGPAEVLVSCIEEPALGLYYLTRFGINFQPHVVLLGVTLGNDLAQSYISLDQGSAYTLKVEHGQVQMTLSPVPKKTGYSLDPKVVEIPPEYLRPRTPLEKVSRWFTRFRLVSLLHPREKAITSMYQDPDRPRLFDAVTGLGVFTQPPPPEIEEAYRRLFRLLEAFQVYCQGRGILFAVLLFPQRYQVNPGDWERAAAHYRLNKARFDLMGPNTRLRAFCQERAIPLIDPTQAMAARYLGTRQPLYLPQGDMHWNREGHRTFFECTREAFGALAETALRRLAARGPGPGGPGSSP